MTEPLRRYTSTRCSMRTAEDGPYVLYEKVSALEAEVKELEQSNEALEKKYADCPHPKGEQYWPCSCSYEKASDVCAVHAPQLKAALARVKELEEHVKRLMASLVLIYDKWENGDPCFELTDGGTVDENGSSLGNAFKLSLEEEQEILNLIVDKAESFEHLCANCGKPYRAHLLHDGNKCAPNSTSGWFPKQIADALLAERGKGSYEKSDAQCSGKDLPRR